MKDQNMKVRDLKKIRTFPLKCVNTIFDYIQVNMTTLTQTVLV